MREFEQIAVGDMVLIWGGTRRAYEVQRIGETVILLRGDNGWLVISRDNPPPCAVIPQR